MCIHQGAQLACELAYAAVCGAHKCTCLGDVGVDGSEKTLRQAGVKLLHAGRGAGGGQERCVLVP